MMKKRNNTHSIATIVSTVLLVILSSCQRDADNLTLATFPATPEVFIDGFSSGLNYAAFGGSKVTAFEVDTEVKFSGTSSMRIEVPDAGDPEGSFAGGVYFTETGRDLSSYNVLTFWMKASKAATINELGFGNDLGANQYVVTLLNTKVNTNWKKYFIYIPDPSLLTSEKGMLWFAEGPEDGTGYTFWIDEVQYENLGTIAHGKTIFQDGQDATTTGFTGQTLDITDFRVSYNLPTGINDTLVAAPAYATLTSSNEAAVSVSGNTLSFDANGTSEVSATIGNLETVGSLTVTAETFDPAPTPTVDEESVISIFSDAYTDVTVDYYNGFFIPDGQTTMGQNDININGDEIISYTQLNFVGIGTLSEPVDASAMTHIHVDINVREAVEAGDFIRFELINAVDGASSSSSVTFDNTTLMENEWVSYDIALSDFSGLASTSELGLIFFVSDNTISNIYVDNIYYYNESGAGGGGTGTEPTTAAPTPTRNAANVISLFSDAYTDVTVDTWRTPWSSADFEDVTVDGNATKKYTNLDFVGIETVASQIDATSMTHIHLDVWSPDFTSFSIKIVDFGADGAFAGGDDTEHQVDFTMPARGEWVSYDIPLSDFTQLLTSANLAQYVLVAQPTGNATVFVDNIYFYQE